MSYVIIRDKKGWAIRERETREVVDFCYDMDSAQQLRDKYNRELDSEIKGGLDSLKPAEAETPTERIIKMSETVEAVEAADLINPDLFLRAAKGENLTEDEIKALSEAIRVVKTNTKGLRSKVSESKKAELEAKRAERVRAHAYLAKVVDQVTTEFPAHVFRNGIEGYRLSNPSVTMPDGTVYRVTLVIQDKATVPSTNGDTDESENEGEDE